MTKRTNMRRVVNEVLDERDRTRSQRLRRRACFWLALLSAVGTASLFYHHDLLTEGIKILIASFVDFIFEW